MRTVVCPRCSETIAMPDELADAFCPRCAHALGQSETHLASGPPPAMQAIQAEVPVEKAPSEYGSVPVDLPDRYANWEEFRAMSPAIQRELMKLATTPLPDLRLIKLETLPEKTPAELDGWGKPLGTLNVPGETRFANRLASVILVSIGAVSICGATAILFPEDQLKRPHPVWFAALITAAMGGFIACLGIWSAFKRRPILSLALWIFEEGLFLERGGHSTVARFEEIHAFEMSSQTGRPLFWITLKDEVPIVLSIGHCLEVMPLMEYAEIRMAGAQLLPRLKAIFAGERERFGKVKLDKAGLHGPGFFAPWPEVRRVMADDHSLFVDWSQRPDWVAIPYHAVSFPHLVISIAYILIEEHTRLK